MTGTWALAVTYVDEANNQLLTLGGAAWKSKRERDRNLSTIPAAARDTNYVLDIESPRGIEDDRYIDRAAAEKLIGAPVAALIAKARRLETGAMTKRRAKSRGHRC